MQLTSREIGGNIAFLFFLFLIFHANNLITSIDKIMVPSKIKVEFKVKIFCHCFLYSGYGYLTFSD